MVERRRRVPALKSSNFMALNRSSEAVNLIYKGYHLFKFMWQTRLFSFLIFRTCRSYMIRHGLFPIEDRLNS